MGSEGSGEMLSDKEDVTEEVSEERLPPTKTRRKVPKRVHKAEREKLKREHLNDLFLELADTLELTPPNNGKASILCEAARLLKDLNGQIECLKKENVSLLSESHYVNTEKDELIEENSVFQSNIEKLRAELEARRQNFNSISELNLPPEYHQQQDLIQPFPSDCLGLPMVEPHASAVLVVPLCSEIPSCTTTRTPSHVSKPHARYPDPADSWPLDFLGDRPSNVNAKKFRVPGLVEQLSGNL